MADREKVIRELEQCLDDSVAAVVPADTVRDALALLKSQDKDAEIIRKCRDGEMMKHVGNGVNGLNRVRRKTRPPIERTKKEITLSWVRSLIRLYPEMTLFEAEAYKKAIGILERLDEKEFN